jgi:predicted ATPase/DNA-binding CsgD family transcriptional regulator
MTLSGSRQRARAARMVGRQAQLSELHAHLAAARRGSGGLVLIGGDAGMGKSRLAREFLAQAASAAGLSVLRGRCYDEHLAVPYAPFVDALQAYLRERGGRARDERLAAVAGVLAELDSAPPPEATADPHSQKRRLFESICRALWPQPSTPECRVVLLEDLHWSDQTSLELLGYLARAAQSARVLLLGTYRADEIQRRHPLARLIADLGRERFFHELRLPPLSLDELAALLDAMLERPAPSELAHAIYRSSEGNPFFAEELVGALLDSGSLDELLSALEQGRALPPLAVPATVKEIILRRTTDLEPATGALLSYAAVIGRRFEFELLQQLTGLGEAELVRALDTLIGRQLIVEERGDEDRYSFRHALIREAVYDDMLGRERRMKHRAVLQALETSASGELPIDLLAYHSLQARELAQATRYGRMAGDRAARMYAFREALAHYENVLELMDGETRERAELLDAMGRAAFPLGDGARLTRYWREALRLYEQEGDVYLVADLSRRLGRVYWDRGEAEGGYAATRRAIELLEGQAAGRELAMAYSALAHLYMNDNRDRESVVWSEKALALAERIGADDVRAHALNNLGSSLVHLGEILRGTAALERSLELALGADLMLDAVRAYLNLSVGVSATGDVRRAAELLRAGLELADRVSVERYTEALLHKLAHAEMELGNWPSAEAYIARAELVTMLPSLTCDSLAAMKADLLLRRGQPEAACALAEAVLPVAEREGDNWLLGCLLHVLAMACLELGDGARAAELMDRSIGFWRQAEDALAHLKMTLPDAAELYLRAGRAERWPELQELIEAEFPDGSHWPHGAAGVAEALGLRAAYEGRQAEAAALFEQAAATWQELRLPYQEARARRRRARSLLLTGAARSQAARELAAARAIASRLGAVRELEAILALESECSAGPRRPRPSRDGLTPREREVVALVAQGYSNRAIAEALMIAEKTAEIHVSNILAKLGAASRAQAAALAVEQGLIDTLALSLRRET